MEWSDARHPDGDEFMPEGFINVQGTLTDDNPSEFLFGFGKRRCPGSYSTPITTYPLTHNPFCLCRSLYRASFPRPFSSRSLVFARLDGPAPANISPHVASGPVAIVCDMVSLM